MIYDGYARHEVFLPIHWKCIYLWDMSQRSEEHGDTAECLRYIESLWMCAARAEWQ